MKHLVGKSLIFAQGDRLFESMWHIMQLFSSLVIAQAAKGTCPTDLDVYQLLSLRFKTVLCLPISGVIEHSIDNVVPASIEFRVELPPVQFRKEPEMLSEGAAHQLSGLNDLCATVVFVNFYERYKPFMRKTWGSSAKKWPPTFAFARVIRNCLSHSGAIAIDEGTAGGKWRKFSYARADDGRKVLGTEIFAVELVYLLLDLADELDRAGAPNLATPAIEA